MDYWDHPRPLQSSRLVVDLAGIPEASLREMHRQAEACLNGTVQLALAADSRATALTGIFGAGAVALLVMVAAVLTGDNSNLALVCAGSAAAALLFFGALVCAWSARPVDFHVGGYEPRLLAVAAGDEVEMIRGVTENIQTNIDANRAALDKAAHTVERGAQLAGASVPVGILVFIVVRMASRFF
jgi:hypothetical protein